MRVQVCGRGGKFCYTTLDSCLLRLGDKRMAGWSKGPTARIKKSKLSKKSQVQVSSKGKVKIPKSGS